MRRRHSLPTSQVRPILEWVFRRRLETITCLLDVTPDRLCRVSLIPHWDAAATVVERFDRPNVALRRHAELAECLRQSGWVLEDYVRANRRSAA